MRRRNSTVWILFLAATATGAARHALAAAVPTEGKAVPPAAAPSFQDEIRPLLQAKCVRCHGGKTTRGDLNLTTPAGAMKGGQSGPVIVPGKPDDSLLYDKVHSGKMPPGQKDPLSAAEVDAIRRWIAAGARFGAGEVTAAETPTQHDVLPILLRRCTACHGLRRQEAGLDLRTARPCSAAASPAPPSFRANPTRVW